MDYQRDGERSVYRRAKLQNVTPRWVRAEKVIGDGKLKSLGGT